MKIKYSRIMFFIFAILVHYQTMSLPIKICLTGQIETILPDYKNSLMNAANLALSQNKSDNIILKTYFYDHQPLSPIKAYEDMNRDQCSAIIGYEYLSDLLLIQRIQKKTDIPIFTSWSSTSQNESIPVNFFIFEPTYEFQVENMINFLKNKYGGVSNALIVTEVDRDDLIRYKSAYVKSFQGKNINYDTFDMITDDSKFEEKILAFIKSSRKKYKYIFLLTGAVGSTNIINHLNDHKIIFIGTENFGSSSNQSVYIRLNDKNVTAYSIRNFDLLQQNAIHNAFLEQYTLRYGSNPNSLSAYTYDAMNIIIHTINKFNKVTPENILKINFNGITGVYIKDSKFHRSNNYVILSIESNGFHYVQ